jgi:hypothetical protein
MSKFGQTSLIGIFGTPVIEVAGLNLEIGHPLRDFPKWLENVQQWVVDFHTQAAHIRNSDLYTPMGVKEQLAIAGNAMLQKLATVQTIIDRARVSLQKLRAQLTVKPTESDAATRAIQSMEIRDALRAMNVPNRLKALEQTVQNGDTVTFDAIRTAPPWMGLFDQATVEAAEQSWAEKRDPETAKMVQAWSDAIDTLAKAQKAAIGAISSAAGIKSDYLKAMGGGVGPAAGGDNA